MFIFAGILFICILSTEGITKLRPLTGEVQHVYVEEIKAGHIRVAKSIKECHFPLSLHFSFEVEHKKIILNLEKNTYMSRSVPVYVTSNGHSHRQARKSSNEFALYQDVLHDSALLVTCQDDLSYRLHGSFRHDGVLYHISHSNLTEPSPQHLIQPSLETNINFDHDAEFPHADDVNVRSQMYSTVSNNSNNETSSHEEYVIELLITVDKAFYEKFSDFYGSDEAMDAMEQYIAVTSNEIDILFRSVEMVDPTLSIRIYLAGVIIPEVGSDVGWSLISQRELNNETLLHAPIVLSSVSSWLRNENGLPQHDQLLALSSLGLANVDLTPIYKINGYGRISTTCSRSGKVSIAIDGPRLALVAAHELGHGLGSLHDTGSCDSQHIMTRAQRITTSIEFAEAQWTFSSCSVKLFKSFINRLNINCLKAHAFTDAEFKQQHNEPLPGTLYSLDQQCQMFNRNGSTSRNKTLTEEGCYAGYNCTGSSDPDIGCEQGSFNLYPLIGTPCGAAGENKWCYRGRCVEKASTKCNKKKKCCFKVDKQKKCCKGPKCCKVKQASETKCFKSCCPQKPVKSPCFKRKCCTKIKVKGSLKKVCCKKDKCCDKKWGKETKCCLTCKM